MLLTTLTVLLIGDSITRIVEDRGAVHGGGQSFAELLSEELPDVRFVNVGCGGATSRDWSASWGIKKCGGEWQTGTLLEARAVANLPADVVVVMLGTNDAAGFHEPRPVPPDEYRQSLQEIIAAVRPGAGHIMLLTPPDYPGPEGRRRELLRVYRDVVLDLCDGDGTIVCGPDVHALVDTELHFEQFDPHPNEAGHRVIGLALRDALRELLEPTPKRTASSAVVVAIGALVAVAAGLALWSGRRAR